MFKKNYLFDHIFKYEYKILIFPGNLGIDIQYN